MYIISFVIVTTALSVGTGSGQIDCPDITEAGLESVITNAIKAGDNPQTPTVDVLDFHPVCLAYSQERYRYRYVSVVVEYTCTDNPDCPSGTAVEQFESECDSGTGTWSHSVQSNTDNTRTENPTANFSTTTREDCAFCFSPIIASDLSLTTDGVTHCVECDSSCNEGLLRCYGQQATQCCQYYNDSMCVDTCPSPLLPDSDSNCDCAAYFQPPDCTICGLQCENGGTPEQDNCTSCTCPPGFTGFNCAELIDCGDLVTPVSGVVSADATTYTSVATYSCSDGYTLTGESNRTCLSSGNWSGSEPTCTACEVKNCSTCDGDYKTCEQCSTGYELSNNECKCPVTDCMVCDTDVSKCDLCGEDNAVFDDRIVQCVIQNPTGEMSCSCDDCCEDCEETVRALAAMTGILGALALILIATNIITLVAVYKFKRTPKIVPAEKEAIKPDETT